MPALPADYHSRVTTPVYHQARSEAGARAHVTRSIDNVEGSAEKGPGGFWIPVARLRADQAFMRPRLEERGIKCVVLAPGTHVSREMTAAGARKMREYLTAGFDDEDAARATYLEMEKYK